MKTVFFQHLYHHNRDLVAIRFEQDSVLNRLVRRIRGIGKRNRHQVHTGSAGA